MMINVNQVVKALEVSDSSFVYLFREFCEERILAGELDHKEFAHIVMEAMSHAYHQGIEDSDTYRNPHASVADVCNRF